MILFIYTSFSTFVREDYGILKREFAIDRFQYKQTKKILEHGLNQIKLFFWLINRISKAETIYIWFADYHSFLPVLFAKLFKKKSFIVLGGYDVTYIKEFNYGSFNNPLRAALTKYSLKNASMNLPVCDNIRTDALDRVASAKTKIMYTGYSPKKFFRSEKPQQKTVLLVAGANSFQRLMIKGVDFYLKTAEKMPDVKFMLVGCNRENVEAHFSIPKNVDVYEKVDQVELIKLYQKAQVYAQFSVREGLPNSVCEAMLCECVPVGTNAGGIPIAIGDAGYILQEKTIAEAEKCIREAFENYEEMSIKARKRIIENFPSTRRKNELLEIIKEND
ncbi:MAG: glycosyltransferase family 4 protein [Melioribacteraceae bacterium]|nr:glycosyltransferase family 4 protein [Melioribacteraceae bacterium]